MFKNKATLKLLGLFLAFILSGTEILPATSNSAIFSSFRTAPQKNLFVGNATLSVYQTEEGLLPPNKFSRNLSPTKKEEQGVHQRSKKYEEIRFTIIQILTWLSVLSSMLFLDRNDLQQHLSFSFLFTTGVHLSLHMIATKMLSLKKPLQIKRWHYSLFILIFTVAWFAFNHINPFGGELLFATGLTKIIENVYVALALFTSITLTSFSLLAYQLYQAINKPTANSKSNYKRLFVITFAISLLFSSSEFHPPPRIFDLLDIVVTNLGAFLVLFGNLFSSYLTNTSPGKKIITTISTFEEKKAPLTPSKQKIQKKETSETITSLHSIYSLKSA